MTIEQLRFGDRIVNLASLMMIYISAFHYFLFFTSTIQWRFVDPNDGGWVINSSNCIPDCYPTSNLLRFQNSFRGKVLKRKIAYFSVISITRYALTYPSRGALSSVFTIIGQCGVFTIQDKLHIRVFVVLKIRWQCVYDDGSAISFILEIR